MVLHAALMLLAVVVVILIIASSVRHQRLDFEARFPPISDAEFLARCAPGTNPDVALKVRKIVSDRLGVDYERIYPSTRFVDDLGAD